ncbi:hypothetical protein [Vibrio apostichopi]|uniref:hypothetical protein n=1 Tax=Vibrio apostichopi TaxID=3035453 RepID=UPI00257425F1|nr:hypothetical protein [Vibrio sp. FE10]
MAASYTLDEIKSKMLWSPFKLNRIRNECLDSYVLFIGLSLFEKFNLVSIEEDKREKALKAIATAYEIISKYFKPKKITDEAIVNLFCKFVLKTEIPFKHGIEHQDSKMKSEIKTALDHLITSEGFSEYDLNSLVQGSWANYIQVSLNGNQCFEITEWEVIISFSDRCTYETLTKTDQESIW